MTINYPSTNQTNALRQLWKLAFGDEDDFLDVFFSRAFDPSRCSCITEDGQILAALYWFRTSCFGQDFAYLYAIATHPNYRGMGLCRALVEDTKQILKAAGYHGALLVPDGERLAGMYRKMGFEFCTSVQEFECDAALSPVPLRQISAREYAQLRRNYLGAKGVVQEGGNLSFLSALSRFYAGENWLAVIGMEGAKLHCHELLGCSSAAPGIVAALGCTRGFFRIPGSEKPFAMVCPLDPDCVTPAYFGLAFD